MTVGALLLDLDDTLCPEWPPIIAAWTAVAATVWGAADPELESRTDELWQAARAVWHDGVPEEFRRRMDFSLGEALYGEFVLEGPEADALRAFVPVLHATAFDSVLPDGWVGRSPELVARWVATRLERLTLFDEVEEVLSAWQRRVPLIAVTNGAHRLQHAKLRRVGLERFLAGVVVGEDVGAGKPATPIFERALALAGVAAADAVMVGNSLDRDVAGARAAGIRAVHLDRESPADAPPAPDTIRDLRELDALLAG